MIANYLKLALRNLWKNKIFSGINIFGLSVGLTVCILILLFVQYERSFDAFHSRNLYRLNEVQSFEGLVKPQKVALSMFPMGPTLKSDFPEVLNYTRITPDDDASLRYKDNKVFFKKFFWADSSFFSVFGFKLLKGRAADVLNKPNSVVLTETSAKKLFGSDEAMGKTIPTNNRTDTLLFTVTGIMEDVPQNSHLQFEGLYSFNTRIKGPGSDMWGGNWVITYLELDGRADVKKLESKLPAYLQKYTHKDVIKDYQLFLQPVREVHSGSSDITHDYHNEKKFDSKYTSLFLLIAIVVLIIGCMNFINLSTARSIGRAKEVGVRKSIGALRQQLAMQFLGESVLMALISTFIAIILVKLLLPFVSSLGKHELAFSIFSEPVLLLKLIGGAVAVGLLSGIYPALYLSAFDPVKVLKGSLLSIHSKSLTRNTLVVVQFACAAFLIIATIFGLRQLRFMQTKDPGFSSEQVVMIPGAYKNYYRLKTELLKSTLVKGVSGSTQRLGNNWHQTGMTFYGDGPAKSLATSHVLVDHEFLSLFGIKLAAGRNFTEAGIGKEFIINETMAKKLLEDDSKTSYESLLGKRIDIYNDTAGTVVGVAKDFNFNSLHNGIETVCLYNKKPWGFHDVCVKIDGARTDEALKYIKETWEKVIPHFPYSYQFLDEHFAMLYEADRKVSQVVGVLAGLAILIACLGLFGLASYASEKRTKEIGIRKVMGASVRNIVLLLSLDFIKLVLLANLIAWPLAWYVVSAWLQNYAFRIEISWPVFLLSGLVSLLIALLTIGGLTFRSATANPVKSLRTE